MVLPDSVCDPAGYCREDLVKLSGPEARFKFREVLIIDVCFTSVSFITENLENKRTDLSF